MNLPARGDLGMVGVQAASLLCGSETGYRAFARAGKHIGGALSAVAYRVQLYVAEHDEQFLSERVVVEPGEVLEGSDVLAVRQLPAGMISAGQPVQRGSGTRHETLIPLVASDGLVGLLILTSTAPLLKSTLERLKVLGDALAIGVQYAVRVREAERTIGLLRAVTRTGRELEGISEVDRLLLHFVTLAVEQIGFDRATLFVFDEDGETVLRVVCASVGRAARELAQAPRVRAFPSEPQALTPVPGLWIPMRMGARRLGALLVDNLYSLDSTPADAMEALVDLSGQVALALESARLVERLQELALRDDLTGLYRPAYFYERAREELRRMEREGGTAGLLMIDVDRFKEVNDTFGHPAGDAVLVGVADLIRKSLRSCDVACRMGDEFMVLVPGLSSEEGLKLARRLQTRFRDQHFVLPDGRRIRVSISVGLAVFPDDATHWQDLLHRADEAMYLSKRQGRGRVATGREVAGSA